MGVKDLRDAPIALPTAQEIKFAATTTVFFVCPAMFRDIMLIEIV